MSNTKNTVIGFVLIFAILIGYYYLTSPSKEELAKQQRINDSIANVKRQNDSLAFIARQDQILAEEQKALQDSLSAINTAASDESVSQLVDQYGAFAMAAKGEVEHFFIENDLIRIGFSSLGGKIVSAELKNYKTFDGQPLMLIESDSNKFGLSFFALNRTINTNDFYFQPVWIDGTPSDENTVKVTGKGEARFAMRLYASSDTTWLKDKYIEYLYTIKGDKYMVDVDLNFHNLNNTIDAARGYVDFEWSNDANKKEKHVDQFNGSTIYYKINKDDVNYLSESKDDEKSLRDQIKWVSFKEQFFSTSLIADNYFVDPIMQVSTSKTPPSDRYIRSFYYKVGMPFTGGQDETVGMSMFFGPNKYNVLRKYKVDLERQIPLGWSFFLMQWINRYAVLPVFNFLGSFGWNYGIVILILTVLLKIVLLPIAYKTYLSSAKMRLLKPEIDEISAKFPKKEDAMKKQQATMAMYKKAGVNPMSGCIPILLQMPILIAMFRFFPASIELRQQSFLWAADLSTYDSIFNLPFNIPFYGDHVSLFTLLMTISTIIYTHLNNQMMGSSSQQLPGMKTMMYIMPVMFLGIFNNYSSGLSYYYLLVNLFTFAQMYLFKYFVDEDKLHKKIQENKLKPVKTSSFQKRLENMAKQRGYNPPKKR